MRALVTGISTWIIPTIAAAANLIRGQTGDARRNERPKLRLVDGRDTEPGDRLCDPAIMHERFKAKVEAMIWPD